MERHEVRFLEDYVAIAARLVDCKWAQLTLHVEPGKLRSKVCSSQDRQVLEAFDALEPVAAPFFFSSPERAGLPAMSEARVRAAGFAAFAAVSHRFPVADGIGTIRLDLADWQPRAWGPATSAHLSSLLKAVAGHAALACSQHNGQEALRREPCVTDDYRRRLHAAETLAHVGSWVYEPAADTVTLSPELVRILDLPPATGVLRPAALLEPVHPDDRGRVALARRAMLDNAMHEVEYRVVDTGGAVRWLRERSALQADRGDKVLLRAAVQDVSAEKNSNEMASSLRHEAALAQQQFRAIFESSPTPYLVLTPDRYRIVAVSDAYLKATMVTRERIMGRELFDVFPDDPSDREAGGVAALSASLDKVRTTRAPDVMAVQRYPVRRPEQQGDGFVVKYWSPVNSPVLNADGSVAFILHRVEDVTDYVLGRDGGDIIVSRGPARQEADIVLRSLELKRLADSLAESEMRFRYMSRATHDVVWDWTIDSGALWCGESAQQSLSAALAGVSTLPDWACIIHPDDRPGVIASLNRSVAARSEHWSAEYGLLGRGGERLDVLHRSFLIVDEQGRATRMVGSITDITERKRQESRLREQAELLDNATDAILVRDLDNRVMYWNKAAVKRYGWTAEEVVGRPISETLYAACPAEEFDKAMKMLFTTGDYSGRMLQSTRDGRRLVVHTHWILVRHDDGAPRAILSVTTDLSDRIAIEERLAQVQKLEALGRLTGGIAHDFNNWLTVIIGNAEELVDELQAQPGLIGLADMIQMAGQRAAELTRRLLTFARRQSLEPETLDVQAVIEGARPLIERSLRGDITLALRFPAERWLVYVDRSQLEAAILNLCINARDAMPDGGRLEIEVSHMEVEPAQWIGHEPLGHGKCVVISVADNGCGIPTELIGRVFEPFFTTKADSGGSGLGLSMVYGFAKQSNGNVTLDSEPQQGTRVRLYLPRSDRGGHGRAPMTEGTASVTPGRRILLVEDDPSVRGALGARLAEQGYAVTACASGMEALELLDQGLAFDLLFTDVVMPSMSGIELAERARTLQPGLRVLLTSGYPFDALHEQGDLAKRYPILHKPYGKRALVEALEAAMPEPESEG